MSEDTKIQWATHTFSPWEGCTKISPGCANCYAEARNHRFGMDNWGKGKPRRRTSAATWRNPVKWNLKIENQERPRVFPSLCDPFDEEVPIARLADFLKLIHDTPNLDWLLLTKRPENCVTRLNETLEYCRYNHSGLLEGAAYFIGTWLNSKPPHNVWLGVSVEDQKRADERIPELLKIPAVVRFLSVEPLLEQVDLRLQSRDDFSDSGHGVGRFKKIDWAIFGGESGPGARPCNIEWIRDGMRQCRAAGVPVFVKQLGGHVIDRNDAGFDGDDGEWPMDTHYREIDHGYQGAPIRILLKDKKGGEPCEWPEDLRVREFPKLALIARV